MSLTSRLASLFLVVGLAFPAMAWGTPPGSRGYNTGITGGIRGINNRVP